MNAGDVIGDRYRLDQLLGRGGFGVVWRAWHIPLERTVAIKFLHATDPSLHQRFTQEARALGRLTHPNCIRVFDTGITDDGTPFIVMEFVPGRPLTALSGQRLAISEIVNIAQQLADALVYAHSEGVVHRDLKPDNILLVENGGGPATVKVVDFGIAKITKAEQQDITKTGEVIGTPEYMSPEQLLGRGIGPKSDLYAVGLILHELIEGRRPFRGGDPLAAGMAHLTDLPAEIERADCPPFLKAVVERLLRRKASERYADARTLRLHLSPDRPRATVTDEAPARRPALLIIGTATLVAVVGIAIGVALDGPPTVVEAETRRVVVTPPPPEPKPDVSARTADTGPSVAVPAIRGAAQTSGCGEPVGPRGFVRKSYLVGIQASHYTRVIPSSYDPNVPMPLALVLPGGNEDKVGFLRQSGLPEMAEERGMLLLSSDALEAFAYEPSLVSETLEFLEHVGKELCFNPQSVFVIGHSHGATSAERLACESWVAGAALSSHGRDVDTVSRCNEPHPVPTIAFWPLKSGNHPIAGGNDPTCRDTKQKPLAPLEDQIVLWRERQGCDQEEGESKSYTDGVCITPKCDVPFKTCRLDGGHGWPGTPPRRAELLSPGQQRRFDVCDGVPANFPTADVIGEFFAPFL